MTTNFAVRRRERKGSVAEMAALDLAAEQAWSEKDHRLMAVATAAWEMLGWVNFYLAEDISLADRDEAVIFQENSVYGKNRRLLRAEARGFMRCLEVLERAELLSDRDLREAKRLMWVAAGGHDWRDRQPGKASEEE